MSKVRPEPVWRRMTPHAFGYDGFRWHVRAYCHLDNKFKDFLLPRILDIGELGEAGADACRLPLHRRPDPDRPGVLACLGRSAAPLELRRPIASLAFADSPDSTGEIINELFHPAVLSPVRRLFNGGALCKTIVENLSSSGRRHLLRSALVPTINFNISRCSTGGTPHL
jgi:hypothetical protein